MKTRIRFSIAVCMLLSQHCFCQVDTSGNTLFTYHVKIPHQLPQKIYSQNAKKNKDTSASTFVFIEFGDGTFATSTNGIDSNYAKHYYQPGINAMPLMFLSSVYDTTKRPNPTFFARSFNRPVSTLSNNPSILESGKSLRITPSASDSTILLRDSITTFAITYKLAVTQTLPVKLVVNYGDSDQNVFMPVIADTQTINTATDYNQSGDGTLNTIPCIRTYNNAVLKMPNGIAPSSRKIVFTIDNPALKDGKEHSVFITLKTSYIDITDHNDRVIINARLQDASAHLISKTSFQMRVFNDGLTRDPNKLIAEDTCLQFKDSSDFKRSNITEGFTLHVENSGDGFVNEITTKTFIPFGFMTPSYYDIYIPRPTVLPIEMAGNTTTPATNTTTSNPPKIQGINTTANKTVATQNNDSKVGTNNTGTFSPIFTPPVYHGDLPVANNNNNEKIDKTIKIDSIKVHGEQLLAHAFFITKEDTVFNLPSLKSNDSITVKISRPFLIINIKNTNADGTNPLLYAYQKTKQNITAEIKFSMQTAREGYNTMVSWSSVNFNNGAAYYTQPLPVYMAYQCPCSCIKETHLKLNRY